MFLLHYAHYHSSIQLYSVVGVNKISVSSTKRKTEYKLTCGNLKRHLHKVRATGEMDLFWPEGESQPQRDERVGWRGRSEGADPQSGKKSLL